MPVLWTVTSSPTEEAKASREPRVLLPVLLYGYYIQQML